MASTRKNNLPTPQTEQEFLDALRAAFAEQDFARCMQLVAQADVWCEQNKGATALLAIKAYYAARLEIAKQKSQEQTLSLVATLGAIKKHCSADDYIRCALFCSECCATVLLFDKAQSLLESCARRQALSESLRIEITRTRGALAFHRGDYARALEYVSTYLHWLLEQENVHPFVRVRALEHVAITYNQMGMFAEAISYYTDALTILEGVQESVVHATINAGIGVILSKSRRFPESIEFFRKALEIHKRFGNEYGIALMHNNLSAAYMNQELYGDAVRHALECLSVANEKYPRVAAFAYSNLAETYLGMGDYEQCVEFAERAHGVCKTIGYSYGEVSSLCVKAKAFSALERYEDATLLLHQSLEIAQSKGMNFDVKQSHQMLHELYEKQGNRTKSREHYRLAKQHEDEIFSEHYNSALRRYYVEYEAVRTRKQAELLGISKTAQSVAKAFERKANQLMQQSSESQEHTIVVRTFGTFSVHVAGRLLSTEDWQRKKARDVFKLLCINHKKRLTKTEIVEKIWGEDVHPTETSSTFRKALSFVRTALEPELKPKQSSRYVHTSGSSYMLDLGADASIDFIEFKLRIQQANEKQGEEKVRLLESAIELYTGEFLKEDLYEEWSVHQREQLHEQLCSALLHLCSYYATTQPAQAIAFAKRILEVHPTHEEAYQMLIQLYTQTQNNTALKKLTDTAFAIFMKEHHTSPSWLRKHLTL